MEYTYITKGVCSRSIVFKLEDGIVKDIRFEGGCSGNTQGIEKLVEGMKADEVISRLKNIRCGFKETSCPDQLATAIQEAINNSQAAE